jgi:hypothetical protein
MYINKAILLIYKCFHEYKLDRADELEPIYFYFAFLYI